MMMMVMMKRKDEGDKHRIKMLKSERNEWRKERSELLFHNVATSAPVSLTVLILEYRNERAKAQTRAELFE